MIQYLLMTTTYPPRLLLWTANVEVDSFYVLIIYVSSECYGMTVILDPRSKLFIYIANTTQIKSMPI